MKLNRRQSIVVLVGTIAVLGFVVDLNFFSGPGVAIPAVASALPAVAAPPPSEPGNIPSLAIPSLVRNQRLSDNLVAWTKQHPGGIENSPDAFVPAGVWRATPPPTAAVPLQQADVIDLEFARKYSLKAIVRDSAGARVLVNGRILRIGDTIGGMKFAALNGDIADFIGPGRRAQLRAAGPAELPQPD